jgi:hypothetical protein
MWDLISVFKPYNRKGKNIPFPEPSQQNRNRHVHDPTITDRNLVTDRKDNNCCYFILMCTLENLGDERWLFGH